MHEKQKQMKRETMNGAQPGGCSRLAGRAMMTDIAHQFEPNSFYTSRLLARNETYLVRHLQRCGANLQFGI